MSMDVAMTFAENVVRLINLTEPNENGDYEIDVGNLWDMPLPPDCLRRPLMQKVEGLLPRLGYKINGYTMSMLGCYYTFKSCDPQDPNKGEFKFELTECDGVLKLN